MILYPKMKILGVCGVHTRYGENKLMEYNEYETAKKFILYRNERTKIRQGYFYLKNINFYLMIS